MSAHRNVVSIRGRVFRRARHGVLAGGVIVTVAGVGAPVVATGPPAVPDLTARTVAATTHSGPVRATVPVFVLAKGRYTSFDVPYGPYAGEIIGINDRGQIVGGYGQSPTDCTRGFLRDRRGRFSRVDVPGAGTTQPFDINDRGQIVGTYNRDTGNCPATAPLQGFLRDARGRFTTIRIPGAVAVQAAGINDRGQVVGQYVRKDGTIHGYRWESGRVQNIDGPDGAKGASVTDINDRGRMVGVYADAAGAIHAFQLSHGAYTTVDSPEFAYTLPFGLNNRGQIAGLLTDKAVLNLTGGRGFVLRRGAGGPFTKVEVPGAVLGTAATDINDAGTVVGLYGNPNVYSSYK